MVMVPRIGAVGAGRTRGAESDSGGDRQEVAGTVVSAACVADALVRRRARVFLRIEVEDRNEEARSPHEEETERLQVARQPASETTVNPAQQHGEHANGWRA